MAEEEQLPDPMPPHEAVQGLLVGMIGLITALTESKAVDGNRLAEHIAHARDSVDKRTTGLNLVAGLLVEVARLHGGDKDGRKP